MISADAGSFGAGASIPGMMRTLLDVGLNDRARPMQATSPSGKEPDPVNVGMQRLLLGYDWNARALRIVLELRG
jgi:hypothetical protein